MPEPRDPDEKPQYTKYTARTARPGLRKPAPATPRQPRDPRAPRAPRTRRGRPPWRRVLKWVVLAALGWVALSLIAFAVSATVHQSGAGGGAIGGGGVPPFGATNILVLGSDARPKGSKEPGASTSGPSRSDTMMLMRVGGGHNSRLSVPRDTVVEIPGHGTQKINAAYAFGGAKLAAQTVEQLLGIQVNHIIEINFANFPGLIDAMGGVNYTGSCVVSKINGGFKNGGYTLRLRSGSTHIDGKQALALARTRHNLCNAREGDLSRARRQQKLLSSMKSRVLSVPGFLRGPLIGWNVPKAITSDMSAPTLFGVFAALAASGTPKSEVLRYTGVTSLPDGEAGLVVSPAARSAAATRFLRG